jgi:hypothetical protein
VKGSEQQKDLVKAALGNRLKTTTKEARGNKRRGEKREVVGERWWGGVFSEEERRSQNFAFRFFHHCFKHGSRNDGEEGRERSNMH